MSRKTPVPNRLWLSVFAAEHHARKVGLGETEDIALTGRGITQGVGSFLQGSSAGYFTIWVGYVGPFGGNLHEGGRDTH